MTPDEAKTAPLADLVAFYLLCKKAYFNSGEPLVDDATFDELEDILGVGKPGFHDLVLRLIDAEPTPPR